MAVESLKELNEICQKPRYKEVGNWMVRKILRPAALPITWVLLHTNITANQVTLVSIVIGLFGIYLLSLPGAGMFLAGCLLLHLWYLLDHVDGQIARYRKTVSATGRFYDFVMHHLIHGVLFWGLAGYLYTKTHSVFFLLWGFWTCISVIFFNAAYDIQYKTFFEKLKGSGIRARIVPALNAPGRIQTPKNPLKKGFSLLHKSAEMHVLLNLLTLASLLDLFTGDHWDSRYFFFIFYGSLIPALTMIRYTHWIFKKKVDSEYYEHFEDSAPLKTGPTV